MALPIMLIHRGDGAHLRACIAQARRANPDSPLILLGDEHNAHYRGIEHVPITEYMRGAVEFARVYRHMSVNAHEYELFCFQRWFALAEYQRRAGIDRFMTMDSDVLLFADVTRESERLAASPLAYHDAMCHIVYVNRAGALDEVCDFLTAMYTDPPLRTYFEDHYRELQDEGARYGISDMTAFTEYRHRAAVPLVSLSPMTHGMFYDSNINLPEGFRFRLGMKRYYWKNDMPYGRHAYTGQEVCFQALHFQGGAKRYMPYCRPTAAHHLFYLTFTGIVQPMRLTKHGLSS